MSLAVNIAMDLVGRAGRLLRGVGSRADVEIIEVIITYKEDAPSGTALKFGRIVKDVMGQTSERHGREGRPCARPVSEVDTMLFDQVIILVNIQLFGLEEKAFRQCSGNQ